MSINLTNKNRVYYTLWHKDFGTIKITEPVGWNTYEKEYARNEKYHGVFAKFSNNLKFVSDGADFIKLIRNNYGVLAQIKLTRHERHPNTDEWFESYSGFLDLMTYVYEKKQVKVKFNDNGIFQKLKSRESEKIEIERTTTLGGRGIPELETEIIDIDKRDVFLNSKALQKNDTQYVLSSTSAYYPNNENYINVNKRAITVRTEIDFKENDDFYAILEEDINVLGSISSSSSYYISGTTGNMFIANAQEDKTVNVKLKLRQEIMSVNTSNDPQNKNLRLLLLKYNNEESYNFVSETELYDFGNPEQYIGSEIYSNENFELNIEQGCSYAIVFEQYIDVVIPEEGNVFIQSTSSHIFFNSKEFSIEVEEEKVSEATSSKVVFAKELGERIVQILTDKDDAFYSEALTREENNQNNGAFNAYAHGHWLRGFDKFPEDESNKYKKLTTSFKDYVENLDVTWNLGLGIEKVGLKDRVRIENTKYFYQDIVTIKLPNKVKNIKRTEANELYYSSLEFGYTKGAEYEEAMGLDEYNGESSFSTVIDNSKNKYSKKSKYRADSYGILFASEKQKVNFPTEDTGYDKDIFALDLKKVDQTYKLRTWQDDFEQQPTGIYSPDTATNLRLSPFNIMLRHDWMFASGLTKYPQDYIYYSSSTSNSNLSTKLNGNPEYSESGNIQNSALSKPRFVNEWIEFEHVADFDVIQQVEGTTIVDGKEIYNFYGLVEFINENNEQETGYLFNLKPNGVGKWKLLKSNR